MIKKNERIKYITTHESGISFITHNKDVQEWMSKKYNLTMYHNYPQIVALYKDFDYGIIEDYYNDLLDLYYIEEKKLSECKLPSYNYTIWLIETILNYDI